MSYTIPAAALSILSAKVDQFNRRGAKRGFAPLTITTVRTFEQRVSETLEGGIERRKVRMMAEIEIAGEVPVLAGHTFLANVQHMPAGNIVRRAPVAQAADLPEAEALDGYYRTAEPECTHCGAKRARKDTFVLRTPENTLVQIGRNCLAAYIGSADPEIALRLWALAAQLERTCEEGEAGGWGGCSWYVETGEYLQFAAAAVRAEGFKPSSFDESTRSRVSFAMGREPRHASGSHGSDAWHALQPTDADRVKALAVRAWVAEQPASSDYMHSLRVACACPTVERTEGLLCSAISAYDKAMGAARLHERAAAVSEHFGTVGKREVFAFTVTRKTCIDGDYGTRTIVGLEDASGRAAVWFASGLPELAIGDKVQGKATVKAHGDYKGTKQTTLSRCAFEVLAPVEKSA